MSCCGQKRSQQKLEPRSAGAVAADAYLRRSQSGLPSLRTRPGDPQPGDTALRNYLTRNTKSFAR